MDRPRKATIEKAKAAVGKLFVHTPKAIRKAGAPSDAVYAVVEHLEGKRWLLSWQCFRKDGKLEHPAFPGELLEPTDSRLFLNKTFDHTATHGYSCFPAYIFCLDSFYKPFEA